MLAGLPASWSADRTVVTRGPEGAPGLAPATVHVKAVAYGYDEAETDVPLVRLDRVAPLRLPLHSPVEKRGRVILELNGFPACALPATQRDGVLQCLLRASGGKASWFFDLVPRDGTHVVIDGIPLGNYTAFLAGPGRDAASLPAMGGKREIEVTEADAHWPIDVSNSGCIRFRVLRLDGSEFRGDVHVTVKRSVREHTRAIEFSKPDYVLQAVPAGSYLVRIETPREGLWLETELVVRAGEETPFELTLAR